MASDFKVPLKLTVDGESDVKKALKECSDNMAYLNTEAKKCKAEFNDNRTSLEALSKQNDIAAEKVKMQAEKVKILTEAYEKSSAGGEKNAKATMEYAKQLNNAEADLIKLQDAAKKASSEFDSHNTAIGKVKDTYNNAKQSVDEFKEAHPKVAKAMETAKSAAEGLAKGGLEVIKGAAVAATAAIGAVVTGAVKLGESLYESASEAAEYGDAVDKASQKMGVSAETYQELSYAADLSGTSINTLQKATQKLQAAGSELDISEALDQLYSIEDADERAAAAHEMFGDKIANELAPMLNQGKEGFEAATQAAEDYGLVMSDAAVAASAAFEDTKTTMTDTVTSIKNNLSADLLPGLNEVMTGITDLFTGKDGAVDEIVNGIDDMMDGLDTMVDKVGNILGRIIDAVMEKAPEIINSLVTGLTDNIDKLTEAALTLVSALVEGLLTQENIRAIMDGAVGLISNLVDFLAKNAKMLIDAACTIITTLIEAFSNPENSKTIIGGCIDCVGAIVSALIDNAPEMLKAALEMGKALVNALIDYDWVKLAKSIYNSIKSSIISFFKGSSDSDGGHAGGLDYVPYNGYSAVLHQGERVLTAAEAQEQRNGNSDLTQLNAKVDFLMKNQQSGDVNVNVSGSAGAIVRALNIEIEREGKRKSAFA